MNTTNCRDCGGTVSTSVATCIHCGAESPGITEQQLQSSTKWVAIVILVIVISIIATCRAIIVKKEPDTNPTPQTFKQTASIQLNDYINKRLVKFKVQYNWIAKYRKERPVKDTYKITVWPIEPGLIQYRSDSDDMKEQTREAWRKLFCTVELLQLMRQSGTILISVAQKTPNHDAILATCIPTKTGYSE